MADPRRCPTVRLVIDACAVATCVSLVGAAAHGGVHASYAGSEMYIYKFTHVPDFDQRRAVLPGLGDSYCSPAAGVNWMAYFANHGAPWIPPGPGWWQSEPLYDQASLAILEMGQRMSTHPTGGTLGAGRKSGLMSWLFDAGAFCFISQYLSDTYDSPTFQDVSNVVFAGGYVMVGVGWYTDAGYQKDRNGGHSVSLTYGARSGGDMLIGWRDPASDDGDLFQQSLFSTEEYPVVNEMVWPVGTAFPRLLSKPTGYGSGNGYIDSYTAILPIFALTSTWDGLGFSIHPAPMYWGEWMPIHLAFPTIEVTEAQALALHPDATSFLYLAASSDPGEPCRLWRTDRIAGETYEVPVVLDDPRDLAVGRRRGLYVLDDDDLVLVPVDLPQPGEVVRVTPPHPCDVMCCDDGADQIALLSVADHRLLRYPYHLDMPPEVEMLPMTLPLAGRARIKWDASRDCVWIVSEATDALSKLWVDPNTGQLEAALYDHPSITAPLDVDVDDAGRLFVSSGGELLEFEIVQDALVPAPDPHFAGVPAGALLCIPKSSTNYDEAVHGTPAWHEIPPVQSGEPIFDCPCDIDDNGAVDVQDLLTLLAAWGPCPPNAFCEPDFNYSGAVDVEDLLMLLAAWGPCPG